MSSEAGVSPVDALPQAGGMRFTRIRYLLAAYDRLEFCEVGLSARLDAYVQRSAVARGPSRKQTVAGLQVMWGEP